LRHRTAPAAAATKVGPSGTIIGIDASAQMLEVAHARVTEHGWNNVHLLAAPGAQAQNRAASATCRSPH
jgi:ubiquinone/menaquinone biosynthesis C-methylase UbiE